MRIYYSRDAKIWKLGPSMDKISMKYIDENQHLFLALREDKYLHVINIPFLMDRNVLLAKLKIDCCKIINNQVIKY
jgi:hypothetical protein